ncbi:hypothetical protein WMY93_027262 [Mugilogobius chulae]|uniref:Uncharacterized protein n=1 Tax=Mugilogobius chulae TaxID=88201 RepID=A0AAW0MSF3_9GOBI
MRERKGERTSRRMCVCVCVSDGGEWGPLTVVCFQRREKDVWRMSQRATRGSRASGSTPELEVYLNRICPELLRKCPGIDHVLGAILRALKAAVKCRFSLCPAQICVLGLVQSQPAAPECPIMPSWTDVTWVRGEPSHGRKVLDIVDVAHRQCTNPKTLIPGVYLIRTFGERSKRLAEVRVIVIMGMSMFHRGGALWCGASEP